MCSGAVLAGASVTHECIASLGTICISFRPLCTMYVHFEGLMLSRMLLLKMRRVKSSSCTSWPCIPGCTATHSPLPDADKRVRLSYDDESGAGGAGAMPPPSSSNPSATGHATAALNGSGPDAGASQPERRFRGQRVDTPSHPGRSNTQGSLADNTDHLSIFLTFGRNSCRISSSLQCA